MILNLSKRCKKKIKCYKHSSWRGVVYGPEGLDFLNFNANNTATRAICVYNVTSRIQREKIKWQSTSDTVNTQKYLALKPCCCLSSP